NFEGAAHDVEEILELAAATLSRLSDNVALVTGPTHIRSKLLHVELVLTRAGQALLVAVANGSAVYQRVVEVDPELDQELLTELAGRLNRAFGGMGADQIESAPEELAIPPTLTQEVARGLRQMETRSSLVIHDGVRNLVRQPEFEDPQRLRTVLEVLEAQRILGAVVTELAPQVGMQVVIGHENSLQQLRDCSLVLTSYRAGDHLFGTIGVVGPTRIRYGRVAARLQLVAQVTGEALGRLLA
ncbi:MAG: hypothetical protein ACYDEA_06250, partial [Candidatus Dormibacteria bacterium]